MRNFILAIPAVTLLATTALAQTDTTTEGATMGADTTGEMFGTSWPLSVGTTFFSDADTAAVRSTEELGQGWQSLSQEDRDMILADCQVFMAAHGDTAAAGAEASTDGDAAAAGTAAATDTTTAAPAETTTTTTGTDAATDTTGAATTPAPGYDMAQMKAICEAAGTL